MTLKDFVFEENNHFIGVQTHLFFGRSIYLVLITKNFLIGLELNKSLSVENTDTLFTQVVLEKNTPRGAFSNPYSYLKEKYVRAVEKKYLFDQSIFAVNKRNFRIDRIDIEDVVLDSTKINGFNYPHEGKLEINYIKRDKYTKGLKTKKTMNFIILGEQNIKAIVSNISHQQMEATA